MDTCQNRAAWTNVHPLERWASVLGGGAIAIWGLKRGRHGIPQLAAGAAMIQRGVTGQCHMYRALGVRTSARPLNGAIPYELGVKVRVAVTINRPRTEMYAFWKQLENLPKFMTHLVSVEQRGEGISHWVAQGPMRASVSWDAEIIGDQPYERIAWRSLPGSQVDSAGSVSFTDAPGERGTEIRVELQYNPPAGSVGVWVAKLFGKDARQEINADLLRLKQSLESGEVASTEGQPSGAERADDSERAPTNRTDLEEVFA